MQKTSESVNTIFRSPEKALLSISGKGEDNDDDADDEDGVL